MDENKKTQLTTEEELRDHTQSDRLVDLIIDLIAERSEEKALEVVDLHEREYDHNRLY